MDLAELGLKVDSSEVAKGDKALDDFSKSAKGASDAASKFEKDAGNASSATGKLKDAIDKGGVSFQFIAGAVAAAAAAIGTYLSINSAIHAFIDNTSEAQRVQSQLAAALSSTGKASGQTLTSLNALASQLQSVSTYEDDAIGGAESILLTFTKIGKDVFPEAAKQVLNVATRLGGDLTGAATQVGKALNDPIQGLTMLRRVGIQFTQSQQDMIKSMVEAGNQLGAQQIILKELEHQFGNSAAAARDTLGGALQSLSNAWGNLFEVSGPGVANLQAAIERLIAVISDPAFMSFVNTIGNLLFNALSIAVNALALFAEAFPTIINAITPLLPLLIATFGPVVLGYVLSLATAVGATLVGAFGALFALILANPITAFLAVVVTLLSYFVDWQNAIANLIALYGKLKFAIDAIRGASDEVLKGDVKIVLDATQASKDIISAGENIASKFTQAVDDGGSLAAPKLQNAMVAGGAGAAQAIKAGSAQAATAAYQALNGVPQKVYGAIQAGSDYMYNQVTGEYTKASHDVQNAVSVGGDAAANSMKSALTSGGQSVAQSMTIAGQTVSGNIADALEASALYVAGQIRTLLNSQIAQADASAAKDRADARATLANLGNGTGSSTGSSGSSTGRDSHFVRSFQSQSYTSGFATGGSFTVPGAGGTDSKQVSFRATPGEQVTVSSKQGGDAGDKVTINNFLSAEDMIAAMGTQAGKKVITNIIKSDPRTFRAILGVQN